MVWCGDRRGGIWCCLAGNRARVQSRGLDQPLGSSSSSRRMDQPLGPSWPVDQPLGSSSRWMGKLVVRDTVDLFTCPRKSIPL
jgi:hypothetical protein